MNADPFIAYNLYCKILNQQRWAKLESHDIDCIEELLVADVEPAFCIEVDILTGTGLLVEYTEVGTAMSTAVDIAVAIDIVVADTVVVDTVELDIVPGIGLDIELLVLVQVLALVPVLELELAGKPLLLLG